MFELLCCVFQYSSQYFNTCPCMPRIRIVFRVFGSFFVICSPSKQSIQNYSLIPCGLWILRIQCQEKHETLRNQHSNAEGQNSDCCTRTYPPSVRPGLPWLWCRHPIFQSSSPWLIFLELNADNGHDSCMMQMLQNPARNIRNQLLDPFNWDTCLPHSHRSCHVPCQDQWLFC